MQGQRGRPSLAATSTVPFMIDARAARPEPPPDFTDAEKALWQSIVYARRPGTFSGAESLLQSFVFLSIHAKAMETELRRLPLGKARQQLAKEYRATVAQCGSLARLLRLSVNSRVDRNTRHDGDQPLMESGYTPDDRRAHLQPVPNDAADLCDPQTGERSFERLRARLHEQHANEENWVFRRPDFDETPAVSAALSAKSEPEPQTGVFDTPVLDRQTAMLAVIEGADDIAAFVGASA